MYMEDFSSFTRDYLKEFLDLKGPDGLLMLFRQVYPLQQATFESRKRKVLRKYLRGLQSSQNPCPSLDEKER